MPITDEDYFEKIKKIDVLADELETEITASMQTCLIRFGEIVQIQNAMIQKMHALSDEIFQLRAQAGLENVICRASGQQEAPKGWDEADPSIPAANNSVYPSPARLPKSRSCCCVMSRPVRSITRPVRKYCSCCRIFAKRKA